MSFNIISQDNLYNHLMPRKQQALTRQKKTQGKYNPTGIRAAHHVGSRGVRKIED